MDRELLRQAVNRARRERIAALGEPSCAECGGDFSEGRYTVGCNTCTMRKVGKKKRLSAEYRARQAAGRRERRIRSKAA